MLQVDHKKSFLTRELIAQHFHHMHWACVTHTRRDDDGSRTNFLTRPRTLYYYKSCRLHHAVSTTTKLYAAVYVSKTNVYIYKTKKIYGGGNISFSYVSTTKETIKIT